MPVEVAAALILQPIDAGLVGFISAVDPREFRHQITPTKAIFNKSNLGLGYFLASMVGHALSHDPGSSPWLLPIAGVVLATAFAVNLLMVSSVIWLEKGDPFKRVIQRLPLGTVQDFSWAFVTWAVLGAMLTALYGRVHPWALVAFLGPTVLTRQMLLRSQAFVDTSRAYRSREAAVREISRRIRDERSDERRLIAADLHDQVLQPLFKVSLVAQVLKADLAGGRLLELDEDLPELLTASDLASVTLRELIGDLRRSALGRGGLGPALTRFVDSLRGNTPKITSGISDVRATADQELALYQIAREALWNSIKHAKATAINVELRDSGDHIVLAVEDNGVGFDPLDESPGHFGIHILRERAQGVGAHLMLDTSPGMGCRISVHVPRGDHS